jgi:hypothetical protein
LACLNWFLAESAVIPGAAAAAALDAWGNITIDVAAAAVMDAAVLVISNKNCRRGDGRVSGLLMLLLLLICHAITSLQLE